MTCPKCGTTVSESEFFCGMCGNFLSSQNSSNHNQQTVNTVLPTEPISNPLPSSNKQVNPAVQLKLDTYNNDLNAQIENIQSINQDKANFNEDLIKAYIGNNGKIMHGSLAPFLVFLFGGLYTIYRKMWFVSLVWFAVIGISLIFLPSFSGYINIALEIIMISSFKKMYLSHVTNKVEKIKDENYGKSKEQLIMICDKKGGTSIGNIFASFGIVLALGIAAGALGLFQTSNFDEMIGKRWIADDNSVLYLNDDFTFMWYLDDSNHDDNYYQGTYNIYLGTSAISYVRDELSRYGITEKKEKERIAKYDPDFKSKALNNYYVLVLNYGKSISEGEITLEPITSPYIGFYYKEEKYFDLIDIKENAFTLTREDSTLFFSKDKLTYKIPKAYEESKSDDKNSYRRNIVAMFNCEVNIKTKDVESYKSATEYLKRGLNLSAYSNVSEIKTEKINGKDWSYMQFQDITINILGTTVSYATIYEDKIYEVSFLLPKDNITGCSKEYDFIYNSLWLK